MSDEIKNKVAESGLITIDLEKFLPKKGRDRRFRPERISFYGHDPERKGFQGIIKTAGLGDIQKQMGGHYMFCRCHYPCLGVHACHNLFTAGRQRDDRGKRKRGLQNGFFEKHFID